MDRAAAQSAFSDYLSDRSLTPQQMRFVEMVIDQLTARGVMEAAALYEPPFSNLHAGGPDELFAGHESVIEGIFEKLRRFRDSVLAMAGRGTLWMPGSTSPLEDARADSLSSESAGRGVGGLGCGPARGLLASVVRCGGCGGHEWFLNGKCGT